MSDALDRLRKRNRPTVPNRDASLTSLPTQTENPNTSTSRNLELQKPGIPEVKTSEHKETRTSLSLEPMQTLQTKQSTLRLEQGISDRLQDICRESSICREVLIEAMFEYCETDAAALRAVLSAAKTKNEYRQHVANLKRAKSMMERFGQSG